jgi:hypothetical protein
LWRSTFVRRIFRPAIDGNHSNVKALIRTDPVKPGLTFHGLRHSHKTWMIDDSVPEIGQSRRLGHHLQDRVVETYSHVAAGVEKRLLTGLEHRWRLALSAVRPTRSHTVGSPRQGSNAKKSRRANKTRRRSVVGSARRAPGRTVERDTLATRPPHDQDGWRDDRPARSDGARSGSGESRVVRDSTDTHGYFSTVRRQRKNKPNDGSKARPGESNPRQ